MAGFSKMQMFPWTEDTSRRACLVHQCFKKEPSSFAFSWKLIINQLCEGYWCGLGVGGAKINPWRNRFLLFFPLSPAYPSPTSNSGPSNPNPLLYLCFLPFRPLGLALILLQGEKNVWGKVAIHKDISVFMKFFQNNKTVNSNGCLSHPWCPSPGHNSDGHREVMAIRKKEGEWEGGKEEERGDQTFTLHLPRGKHWGRRIAKTWVYVNGVRIWWSRRDSAPFRGA